MQHTFKESGTVYSMQFEFGPMSEACIGNVGCPCWAFITIKAVHL